jgi:hypothetical protein
MINGHQLLNKREAKMLPEREPLVRPVDLHSQDNLLSLAELWLRCFALGTINTPIQLAAFFRGTLLPTRHEYNLIAVAINEYLTDIGMCQIVPYVEDNDTAHYLNASWSKLRRSPPRLRGLSINAAHVVTSNTSGRRGLAGPGVISGT